MNTLRTRLGAKGLVALCLLPPAIFGVAWFGPRAGLVLLVAVGTCMATGVAARAIDGRPWRWVNPGSVVTGGLLGLVLGATTPLWMVLVGGLVAEGVGKLRLPGRDRNLINPAVLGRAAVAVLETLWPPGWDSLSGASTLFKAEGGHPAPALTDALFGFTKGAIGETSALLLLLVAVPMFTRVVHKREAAFALLITTPLLLVMLPPPVEVAGHAPWVTDPLLYLLGSATLMNAVFFATDPATTPDTRSGGVIFGVGAAVIGVLGRVYTEIPGAEMYGILVMNLAAPGLDAAVRRARPRPAPTWAPVPAPPVERDRPARLPSAGDRAPLLEGVPFAALRAYGGDPAHIRGEVERAGLRGRGGAGFPAAAKWAAARAHPGPRCLIINAQEGEPETFKDRVLLEHHPHRVVEGAALAAAAMGVERVVFVLDPACEAGRRALDHALVDLRHEGGADALTGLEVVAGPGRYVAGEESALLAFLAGEAVEAQPRPPFPTERGLGGRPTVIHNAETVAWLPALLAAGGAAFAEAGWRLCTVTGAVARPGVYAARADARLSALLARAGGVIDAPTAFAVGGPAGALLPPDADPVLSAEGLAPWGAAVGTGSVRVLGPGECPVRVAGERARFFAAETCGRCTPCRVGTGELARRWAGLLAGGAVDAAGLDAVMAALEAGSTCGLGVGAPAPIRSVQRYWPEQVASHQATGSCERCRASS